MSQRHHSSGRNQSNEARGDEPNITAVGRYSADSLRRLLGSVNSVTFKDETGEVEYFGQKVVMLRRDAFQLLGEELAKRHASGTGNIILGIVGRRVGSEEGKALTANALRDAGESMSLPILVRNAVEETNMGYGKIQVIELDLSSKTATLSTQNSFEAETTSRSGETVCFFLLGYLEGLFSELLGVELRGSETSCRGKGDPACVFTVEPNFQKSKWKL